MINTVEVAFSETFSTFNKKYVKLMDPAASLTAAKGEKHNYLSHYGSRLALSIATCANGATNFSLAKQF